MHFVDFTRDTRYLGQRFMNGQFKLQSHLSPHSTNRPDLFIVSIPLFKWFDNDILDNRKETKNQNGPKITKQTSISWSKDRFTAGHRYHRIIKESIY